jgi:large subunit ribosomal protein L16
MAQRVFIPRKFKYKKVHKQLYRFRGLTRNTFILPTGGFFLKNIGSSGRIRPDQLEAVRRIIRRQVKRAGVLMSYIVCDLPVTSKSVGVRMGKGKGSVDYWAGNLKRGKMLYSLTQVNSFSSYIAMSKGIKKVSLKLKLYRLFFLNKTRVLRNLY